MLDWTWKAFAELTLDELYQMMALRQQVFVVEQRSIYQDADGHDRGAHHLLGIRKSGDPPLLVAYLRVLPPGLKYPEASFGRVVTAPNERGQGHGRVLVRMGLDFIEAHHSGAPIRIGAQAYLRRFYEGFGFQVEGDVYDEDGVSHIDMVR